MRKLYDKYDFDQDGNLTPEEIEKARLINRFENSNERADAQRKMAWIALVGMVTYPVLLVGSVIFGLEGAAQNLTEVAPTYFLSVAGIVAAFFGAEAWKEK